LSLRTSLARRTVFPLVAATSRWGFWGTVYQRLGELERSQWWDAERIREEQLARLRALVHHAQQKVPFYRARLGEIGLEAHDIRAEDDFARIPPLTRQNLRDHYWDLVSEGWQDRVVPNASGGSCGQPVRFVMDPDETANRQAMTIRHNRWAGWDIADRTGILWGAPRDLNAEISLRDRLVKGWLAPSRILNAYYLTPEQMLQFAQELRHFKAEVLFGYARALLEFAQVMTAAGQKLPSLRTVVSSGEALSPESRKIIEQALTCPVYDRYGSRETGVIASECEARNGMHVAYEDIYLEIVGRDLRGTGRILVTKLNSFGMPFIRYDIGDLGSWVQGECSCGRARARLKLTGCRATDFLIGADGQLVSGIGLSVATRDLPEVGTMQLYQAEKGKVEVRVEGAAGISDQLRGEVSRRLRTHLGDIEISFSFPNRIQRTPSGKYRFTVCEVPGYTAPAAERM